VVDEVERLAAPLVGLLNSRAYGEESEALADPARAADVLAPFAPAAGRPVPAQLEEVRALRDDLVALVGRTPDAERYWQRLSERAAGTPLVHEFGPDGTVRLGQVAGDPVIGGILRTVAALVDAGAWPRLKLCAFEPCSGAFFDTTRSRTRRWHSYEACGNRSNVAAHRARVAGRG
jgi:predicted RNA-binding Zn ribbon-like protein